MHLLEPSRQWADMFETFWLHSFDGKPEDEVMELFYRYPPVLFVNFVIALVLLIWILASVKAKQANVVRVFVVQKFVYLLLQLLGFRGCENL